MLTYPQLIASSGVAPQTDYPVLNSSNEIAAKCVWLAMPGQFPKDSAQASPSLFGEATITATGLQVPNVSTAGATWPVVPWSRINSSGKFSIAWFGRPTNWSSGAHVLNIPAIVSTTESELRLDRDGSTAYFSGRWRPTTLSSVFIGSNNGTGDHIIANQVCQYVMTFEGGTVRVYRNGTLIYSQSSISAVPNLQAGRHISVCNRSPDDARNHLAAQDVSLIGIFDDALTQSEIQSLGADPNQLLASASGSYDYPAVNSSHAIGQNILWLADPARFEKDSLENEVTLVGGATRSDGVGVQSAATWLSYATWPQGNFASLQSNNAFTFWLDLDVATIEQWGVYFEISSPNSSAYMVQRNSGTSNLYLVRSGNDLNFSNQHQLGSGVLTITWDGSTARFYRNGSLQSSVSNGFANGALSSNPIQVMRGLTGTFRRGFIANRALSSGEISSLYTNFGQVLLNP